MDIKTRIDRLKEQEAKAALLIILRDDAIRRRGICFDDDGEQCMDSLLNWALKEARK